MRAKRARKIEIELSRVNMYLIILPTKHLFGKLKLNTYQNYLMSLQHDFVWNIFSDAMLYFLFRVKRSYRVHQGS